LSEVRYSKEYSSPETASVGVLSERVAGTYSVTGASFVHVPNRVGFPPFHQRTETYANSGRVCPLEYRTMDKIRKLRNPEGYTSRILKLVSFE
jgi:hypothetical protein